MAEQQNFPFGIDWVQSKICAKYGIESEIESYRLDNKGIEIGSLGSIYRIEIDWTKDQTILPKSVILKVPSVERLTSQVKDMATSQETNAQFIHHIAKAIPKIHRNECLFYSLFTQNSLLPIPTVYESLLVTPEQTGAILMQDMSKEGRMVPCPLELEQLYPLVDALVSLHAFSLRNQSLWQEKNFEYFNKAAFETWPVSLETALKQAQVLKPEYFEGALEKISWCFDLDLFYDKSLFGHRDHSLPEVLVHGDVTGNILFDKAQSSRLVSIIDWQFCHGGNIMEDLARCLVSGLKADVRRENTDRVLEYYYQKLVETLDEKPFEFELVKKSFEVVLPYTLVYMGCSAGHPTMSFHTKI